MIVNGRSGLAWARWRAWTTAGRRPSAVKAIADSRGIAIRGRSARHKDTGEPALH